MGEVERSNPKRFVKCDEVTIDIPNGSERLTVKAARYLCEEDHSDLIVYVPLADNADPPQFIMYGKLEEPPGFHQQCDAIPQPLDAEQGDDPSTARVYSVIRDGASPYYKYYKCAHASLQGEGFGIHFANKPGDPDRCRQDLGELADNWLGAEFTGDWDQHTAPGL